MSTITIIRTSISPIGRGINIDNTDIPFPAVDELIIFPYKPAVESAENELLGKKKVILGSYFKSIQGLANEIADYLPLTKQVASNGYQRVILLQLLKESPIFAKIADGIVEHFLELAILFESNDYNFKNPIEKNQQDETIRIIENYLTKLDKEGFITLNGLYKFISNSITPDTKLPPIFNKRKVIFRGFIELQDNEANFLIALAKLFDEVIIEIEREPDKIYSSLFRTGMLLERKLRKLAKENSLNFKVIDERKNSNPNLKLALDAIILPEQKFNPPFKYICSKDRFEEISFVLNYIKRKLDSDTLDDFVILVGDMNKYAPIINLLAPVYNLPVNIIGYGNIIQSGITQTILSILKAARDGITFRNIVQFYFDPHLNFIPKPIRNELDKLITYATFRGIMNEQIKTKLEQEPDSELKNAYDFLNNIAVLIKPFACELEPQKASKLLEELLSKLSCYSEDENEVITALIDIVGNFPEFARLIGKNKFSQDELINLILQGTSEKRIRQNSSGIKVARLEEGAFIHTKNIFILGMVEGEFPPKDSENSILSREELKSLGLKLPDSKSRHIVAYLRNVVRNNANITISYPALDDEQMLMPSYLTFPFIEETIKDDSIDVPFKLQIALGNEYANLYSEKPEIKLLFSQTPVWLRELMHLQFIRHFTLPYNEYGGIISSNRSKEFINKTGNSIRLSARAIEDYLTCPFKFFIENILKLRKQESPTEELSPLDFGSLIHNILNEFYANRIQNTFGRKIKFDEIPQLLREKDICDKIKITPENLNSAQKEIESILENHIAEKIKPKYPHLVDSNREIIKSILYRFLELELEGNGIPILLEASFGLKKKYGEPLTTMPFILREENIELQLDGIIDRIELTPTGQFVIVDYKTGEVPGKPDLKRGKKVQLQIYALALKELLAEIGMDVSGLAYYQVKKGEVKRATEIGELKKRGQGVKGSRGQDETITGDELDEVLEATKNMIISAAKKICEGEFHPDIKENNSCRSCSYKNICRRAYYEALETFGDKDINPNSIAIKNLDKRL